MENESEITEIQYMLNHSPRKVLGFKTLFEIFNIFVNQIFHCLVIVGLILWKIGFVKNT